MVVVMVLMLLLVPIKVAESRADAEFTGGAGMAGASTLRQSAAKSSLEGVDEAGRSAGVSCAC